jgi:hypothetical protein
VAVVLAQQLQETQEVIHNSYQSFLMVVVEVVVVLVRLAVLAAVAVGLIKPAVRGIVRLDHLLKDLRGGLLTL